jgi:polyisoprenoid-binding protein YceI
VSTQSLSAIPLPEGTYVLDPNHSGVFFQVRHLGLANVRGRFKSFDATLKVGSDFEDVAVTARIDLSSVDTNQADRDAHLLSSDFFNAYSHPRMTFSSTRITPAQGDSYEMAGDLTLNGITQPVTLAVEFNGVEALPSDGKERAGFSAICQIRRADFGVDLKVPLGMGKLAIGEVVKVDIDTEFIVPHH